MNITKEQADKVIAALEVAYKQNGCDMVLTGEELRNKIIPALTIMRGLVEDAEPTMWRSTTKVNGLHRIHSDGPQKPEFKYVEWEPLYTSPQAAQTDEREAFEAWYATKTMPPAYSYTEKLIIEVVKKSAWAGWLGRAGRKG